MQDLNDVYDPAMRGRERSAEHIFGKHRDSRVVENKQLSMESLEPETELKHVRKSVQARSAIKQLLTDRG